MNNDNDDKTTPPAQGFRFGDGSRWGAPGLTFGPAPAATPAASPEPARFDDPGLAFDAPGLTWGGESEGNNDGDKESEKSK